MHHILNTAYLQEGEDLIDADSSDAGHMSLEGTSQNVHDEDVC